MLQTCGGVAFWPETLNVHPSLDCVAYCNLQVLLAIAAGAVLVTPEWLTASLEAGEWLPEEPFLAKVHLLCLT